MKQILLITSVILLGLNLKAQDLRVGLQFSPTISSVRSMDDYVTKSSKIKYSWGVRVEQTFEGKNFSFIGGADITTKGGSLTYDGLDSVQYKGDYNARYLEIPLAVKMRTRQIGLFSYWFNIGLVPGIKIAEKSTINISEEEILKSKVEKLHSPVNLSLLVGAGLQYEITEGTDATFGIIFNNGFTDMTRNHPSFDGNAGFNYFALQLGILF